MTIKINLPQEITSAMRFILELVIEVIKEARIAKLCQETKQTPRYVFDHMNVAAMFDMMLLIY